MGKCFSCYCGDDGAVVLYWMTVIVIFWVLMWQPFFMKFMGIPHSRHDQYFCHLGIKY